VNIATSEDLHVSLERYVATVEIRRPPHNFFDVDLITQLAEAYAALDADSACRAILLCAEGKNFCAGANFSAADPGLGQTAGSGLLSNELYRHAVACSAAASRWSRRCRVRRSAAVSGWRCRPIFA